MSRFTLDWAQVADVRHALSLAWEHVDDAEQGRLDELDALLSAYQRALPDPFHLEQARP